jgi:hypothetical protein
MANQKQQQFYFREGMPGCWNYFRNPSGLANLENFLPLGYEKKSCKIMVFNGVDNITPSPECSDPNEIVGLIHCSSLDTMSQNRNNYFGHEAASIQGNINYPISDSKMDTVAVEYSDIKCIRGVGNLNAQKNLCEFLMKKMLAYIKRHRPDIIALLTNQKYNIEEIESTFNQIDYLGQFKKKSKDFLKAFRGFERMLGKKCPCTYVLQATLNAIHTGALNIKITKKEVPKFEIIRSRVNELLSQIQIKAK